MLAARAAAVRTATAGLVAGVLAASVLAAGVHAASTLPASGGKSARARGVIRSLGEAAISAELPARIVEMPYREGHVFAQGAVLLAFDCTRLQAEQAALQAELVAAQATHDGNRSLEKHKAIGSREIVISGARVDRAEAEVAAGQAKLSGCAIRAPFNGVVVETMANLFEIANPSTPLLRIVDLDRLEIELIAPSKWLGWLAVGDPFTFTVDETGQPLPATIVRLGGVVDPVSQTVKIFATLGGRDARVRPGMSGTATFARAGG